LPPSALPARARPWFEKILLAGVDVARLNFSHGTHAEHAARSALLRAVAKRLDRPLAILQDLQGPKIRVGVLSASLTLVPGQQSCSTRKAESNRHRQ